jgi:hypothetical protein
MTKRIIKHTIFRFLILAIPYFSWFAIFASNNYQGAIYNLDTLILDPFFFLAGLILIETLYFIYKNNKPKYLSNILILTLFLLLYFILPHRDNFN